MTSAENNDICEKYLIAIFFIQKVFVWLPNSYKTYSNITVQQTHHSSPTISLCLLTKKPLYPTVERFFLSFCHFNSLGFFPTTFPCTVPDRWQLFLSVCSICDIGTQTFWFWLRFDLHMEDSIRWQLNSYICNKNPNKIAFLKSMSKWDVCKCIFVQAIAFFLN